MRRLRGMLSFGAGALFGAAAGMVVMASLADQGRSESGGATDEASSDSEPPSSPNSEPAFPAGASGARPTDSSDRPDVAKSSLDVQSDVAAKAPTKPQWVKRIWEGVRRGFNLTVAWLIVGAALALAYAWSIQPDSSVPEVPNPAIDIHFSADHPAVSPVKAAISMGRRQATGSGEWQTVLWIDLEGADFTRPEWRMNAAVPRGVTVNDLTDPDELRRAGVGEYVHGGTDWVGITPGPAPGGHYSARLSWADDAHGPIHVEGANLVAAFPAVTVGTYSKSGDDPAPQPSPPVTVEYSLQPSSDFTFVGGPPPESTGQFEWTWPAQTANLGPTPIGVPPTVEAHSTSLDASVHNREFESGIFYGVAAAGFVAAIQEWLNSWRKAGAIKPQRDAGTQPATTAGPARPSTAATT